MSELEKKEIQIEHIHIPPALVESLNLIEEQRKHLLETKNYLCSLFVSATKQDGTWLLSDCHKFLVRKKDESNQDNSK